MNGSSLVRPRRPRPIPRDLRGAQVPLYRITRTTKLPRNLPNRRPANDPNHPGDKVGARCSEAVIRSLLSRGELRQENGGRAVVSALRPLPACKSVVHGIVHEHGRHIIVDTVTDYLERDDPEG